jgi:putative membrane protein
MGKLISCLGVTIKGICMGAADVIPGVSGGTIAFITGIYDKFVGSLNNVDSTAVKLLFKGKIKELWRHIDGTFLVSLFAGILISVVSLAKLMQYLLTTHPIETWAFFFGLIVASSIFILKGIDGWKIKEYLLLVFGVILGITVCTLSPTTTPDALWFIFMSGAIAICAMILPGISGSFILLILGKYQYIMGTISDLTSGINMGQNIMIIAVFGIGCVVGILSFSKFLHWLLGKYKKQTILVMAGFIIGSLVKVWPWSNMEAIATSQFPELMDLPENVIIETLPGYMDQINMHYTGAIIFAIIGFSLIIGIELTGKAIAKKRES